jgi:hypothetical protein
MDPALRTELKDGLDFDTGQLGFVLVTASRKMLGQAWVKGKSGTILKQDPTEVLE